MTKEDWLLLEALLWLTLPIFLTGLGAAFLCVGIFHNGEE